MYQSKNLKKFRNIKHFFFSKKNGYSKGIYKSLNCGKGSKDSKNNIKKNLNFIAKKMSVRSDNLILMHQTHSNKVIEIKKNNYKKKIFADAMITKAKGFSISVLTADCVPIILYDAKNKVIGCIHAGWRGAFNEIIKNTIFKINTIINSRKGQDYNHFLQFLENAQITNYNEGKFFGFNELKLRAGIKIVLYIH